MAHAATIVRDSQASDVGAAAWAQSLLLHATYHPTPAKENVSAERGSKHSGQDEQWHEDGDRARPAHVRSYKDQRRNACKNRRGAPAQQQNSQAPPAFRNAPSSSQNSIVIRRLFDHHVLVQPRVGQGDAGLSIIPSGRNRFSAPPGRIYAA